MNPSTWRPLPRPCRHSRSRSPDAAMWDTGRLSVMPGSQWMPGAQGMQGTQVVMRVQPMQGAQVVMRVQPMQGAQVVMRVQPMQGAQVVMRVQPMQGAQLLKGTPVTKEEAARRYRRSLECSSARWPEGRNKLRQRRREAIFEGNAPHLPCVEAITGIVALRVCRCKMSRSCRWDHTDSGWNSGSALVRPHTLGQ